MSGAGEMHSWNDQLLELLEYRAVLGAVVTTLDGLVVAHAGLTPDDAEYLAATAKSGDRLVSDLGAIHAREGAEMRLIVLSERAAPAEPIIALLEARLAAFEASLAA